MRRVSLVTMFVALSLFSHAQFIASDLGASLFYGKAKLTKETESVDLDAAFFGVSWYPRYILTEMETGSVSLGIPLTLGFSGSFNSREGGNFSFGLDIPIAVDYNFGLGAFAEEESESGFGGFIGAGFGYTSTATSIADNYNTNYWNESDYTKAKSYGPMGHAGIRFAVGPNQNVITLRVSYKKGLESEKYNFFGGTLLYRF